MEESPPPSSREVVLVKELGAEFMRLAHETIAHYTVAFVDHRGDDPTWEPKLLGSGVLNRARNVRGPLV